MATRALVAGEILEGKWQIEAELGRGGMGSVYAAVHVRNHRKVAIKVLHDELARDPEQRERLLREGYASNRVNHPGIVSVLDDGVTATGAAYLVMERLEGTPLDELAERARGALPLEDVLSIGERWIEVVATAHAAGVVHRDLKPENVFVTTSGVVKVLDFGLASVRDERARRRLTATGVPMGTPAFMPPEQALALWDEVDARSDVYALGASLFTLLTGRLVHEARSAPELLVMVSTRPAAPVATLAPWVPIELARVLDRALRFRRQERFAHAGELLVAFREAARTARVAGASPPPSLAGTAHHAATISPITRPSAAARPRSNAVIAGFVGLALLASVGVVVVLARRPSDRVDTTSAASPSSEPAVSVLADTAVHDSAPRVDNIVGVGPRATPQAAPSPSPTSSASPSSSDATTSATASAPATSPPRGTGTARTTVPPRGSASSGKDPMDWR
ncbi:MAG: serine/threonine-protein kinase [Polyangiaceae bacterium]